MTANEPIHIEDAARLLGNTRKPAKVKPILRSECCGAGVKTRDNNGMSAEWHVCKDCGNRCELLLCSRCGDRGCDFCRGF